MDPFRPLFEAVLDAPAEAAADAPPEGGEAAAEAPVESPASQPWESPEVQDYIAQQVAEGLQARLSSLTQSAPVAEAQPLLLDPFSDDYGNQLQKLIRDEIRSANEPLTQRFDAEDTVKADAQVAEMIDEEVTRAGGFPADVADEAKALVKMIAPSFGDEMVARYGQTDRAAQAILQKATQTVKDLLTKAGKTGGQAAIDDLAAVQGAGTDLPGNGGGINTPPPARSLEELHRRRFGTPLL